MIKIETMRIPFYLKVDSEIGDEHRKPEYGDMDNLVREIFKLSNVKRF